MIEFPKVFHATGRDYISKKNSNNVADLMVDRDSHFKRFFYCSKGLINGFIVGCRPFLGLDDVHMTNKFKGLLLAA